MNPKKPILFLVLLAVFTVQFAQNFKEAVAWGHAEGLASVVNAPVGTIKDIKRETI
jgi:hypothetical protein